MRISSWHVWLLLLILSASFACYRSGRNDRKFSGDDNLAITQLRLQEEQRPNDWQIKRDLGAAYFRTQQFDKAALKLTQAVRLNTQDSRALLYLGLTYEKLENYAQAREAFRRCLSLELRPSLRTELQARVRENERKSLQLELQSRLHKDAPDVPAVLHRDVIAVLYFRNLSDWQELNPVLKGLATLIAQDLEKIGGLRLLPRMRVQVLLEELRLSPADFFDKIAAPQAGRLLGAGRLVSGSIERTGEIGIRLNAGVVDARSGRLEGKGVQAAGNFSDILQLQKQLVRALAADLQIHLSESESAALARPATESNLAFIAFSKGLDFEDRSLFSQARQHYQQALVHDRDFKLAKTHLTMLPEKRLTFDEIDELAGLNPLQAPDRRTAEEEKIYIAE